MTLTDSRNHTLEETPYADTGNGLLPAAIWTPQQVWQSLVDTNQDQGTIVKLKRYAELLDKGWKIDSIPNDGRIPERKLRRIHILTPVSDIRPGIDTIPDDVDIQYDDRRQLIRIIQHAQRSYPSRWVSTNINNRRGPGEVRLANYSPLTAEHHIMESYLPKLSRKDRRHVIKEIPILINEAGSIVCIPARSDAPVVGFIGSRGSGKSYCLHSFIHAIRNQTRIWQCCINDGLKETYSWARPMRTRQIREALGVYSIHAQGLPILPLYPRTPTADAKIDIKLTLPIVWDFYKVIIDYENYFHGRKAWELPPQSGNILRQLAPAMQDCRTIDDIHHIITTSIDWNDKGQRSMAEAILRRIRDVVEQRITNIDTKIQPCWTVHNTVYDGEYTPFLAGMMLGYIPTLITADARTKDYFSQILYYYMNDIFLQQSTDRKLRRHEPQILIHFDEVTEYATIGTRKKVAQEMLSRIVREGRPNRIGFTWAAQYAEKIDKSIWENT